MRARAGEEVRARGSCGLLAHTACSVGCRGKTCAMALGGLPGVCPLPHRASSASVLGTNFTTPFCPRKRAAVVLTPTLRPVSTVPRGVVGDPPPQPCGHFCCWFMTLILLLL